MSQLTIIPTGGALGAEVRNIDLRQPLHAATVAQLHRGTMHRREAFDNRERRLMYRTQLLGAPSR